MIRYLNDQMKDMYHITENDYIEWCRSNGKQLSYKSSMREFIYKLMTKRLVKDSYGNLQVRKPRKKKEKPIR